MPFSLLDVFDELKDQGRRQLVLVKRRYLNIRLHGVTSETSYTHSQRCKNLTPHTLHVVFKI